jgi:hypothetical protein
MENHGILVTKKERWPGVAVKLRAIEEQSKVKNITAGE